MNQRKENTKNGVIISTEYTLSKEVHNIKLNDKAPALMESVRTGERALTEHVGAASGYECCIVQP